MPHALPQDHSGVVDEHVKTTEFLRYRSLDNAPILFACNVERQEAHPVARAQQISSKLFAFRTAYIASHDACATLCQQPHRRAAEPACGPRYQRNFSREV